MSSQDWKAILLAPITELLRNRGFRRKGGRFQANRGEARLLVDLQSSQTSDREHLKITVNLRIQLSALDDELPVATPDGHWRQRIGQLMPGRPDHWWLCHDEESARRAGAEIAAILETTALPEMDRLASNEALSELWATGRSPGLTEHQRRQFLDKLRQ